MCTTLSHLFKHMWRLIKGNHTKNALSPRAVTINNCLIRYMGNGGGRGEERRGGGEDWVHMFALRQDPTRQQIANS